MTMGCMLSSIKPEITAFKYEIDAVLRGISTVVIRGYPRFGSSRIFFFRAALGASA